MNADRDNRNVAFNVELQCYPEDTSYPKAEVDSCKLHMIYSY